MVAGGQAVQHPQVAASTGSGASVGAATSGATRARVQRRAAAAGGGGHAAQERRLTPGGAGAGAGGAAGAGGGTGGGAPGPDGSTLDRLQNAFQGGGGGGGGGGGNGTGLALDPSMFTVRGDFPSGTGGQFQDRTPQMGVAAGHIGITQPPIRANFQVGLRGSVNLGTDTIKVGPIQTLEQSSIVAIYRNAAGRTIEHAEQGSALRDAATRGTTMTGEFAELGAPESPFYCAPHTLTQASRTTPVLFGDRPQRDLAWERDGFRLAGLRGRQSFRVSLSAKQGTALVHLRTSNWSVDWLGAVQGNTIIAGGNPLTAAPSAEPMNPIDSPECANDALPRSRHRRYPTVEDAMTQTVTQLLQDYRAALQQHPPTAAIILQALVRKNPQGHLTLVAEELAHHRTLLPDGADTIQARVRLVRQAVANPQTWQMTAAEQRKEFQFPIFAPAGGAIVTPEEWRANLALQIEVAETTSNALYRGRFEGFPTRTGGIGLTRARGAGRYRIDSIFWDRTS